MVPLFYYLVWFEHLQTFWTFGIKTFEIVKFEMETFEIYVQIEIFEMIQFEIQKNL